MQSRSVECNSKIENIAGQELHEQHAITVFTCIDNVFYKMAFPYLYYLHY